MKYCQHCGAEIMDDAELCPKCGCRVKQAEVADEGSAGAGFCLVFFLGLIGWIIALCVGKPKTKHAANITFIVEIVLGVVLGIIFGVIGALA